MHGNPGEMTNVGFPHKFSGPDFREIDDTRVCEFGVLSVDFKVTEFVFTITPHIVSLVTQPHLDVRSLGI